MRLIDADELLLTLGKDQAYLEDERLTNRSLGMGDAIIELMSAPTVDAVEVVRCKDCKYSKHLKQYPKVNTWKCTLTDVVYRADDYCNFGERKENDGN